MSTTSEKDRLLSYKAKLQDQAALLANQKDAIDKLILAVQAGIAETDAKLAGLGE